MTRLLEQAFAEVSRLPESEQNAIAEVLLAELASERRWEELFAETQAALENLAEEALAEHRAGKTTLLAPSMLAAETTPPAAALEPPIMEGTSTLLGKCVSVGGMEPVALLRPLVGGKLIRVKATPAIAKSLAALLYEDVLLEGSARWRADTWEMQEFEAYRVTLYRQEQLTEVFKGLAETANGHWNDGDAVEYVRQLRHEDDE